MIWRRFHGILTVVLFAPSLSFSQSGRSFEPKNPPPSASTSTEDTAIQACFVPASGTIYRIGLAGLPQSCLAASHVRFSWQIQGLPGSPGPQGVAGAAGAAGQAGPIGATGPAGAAGSAGATGPVGAAGPAGALGPAGPIGATGPAGPIGATGPTGPIGATGPAGLTCPAGNDGASGPAGPLGATGPIGPAGPAGATGPAGGDGANGPAGPAGPTGPAGAAGPAGASGTASVIVRTATTTGNAVISAMCSMGEVAVGGGVSVSASGREVRSSGPAISAIAFAAAGQTPIGWRGNSNGVGGDITTVYAVCAPGS